MRVWAIALMASLAASGAVAKSHKHHRKEGSPPPTSAGPRDANGSWAVQAQTSVGNCSGLIPSGLTIADNKIQAASGANVAAWGYVDETGNIVARFTGDGSRVARFHGVIKGGRGSGAWSSSTDMCGGTWRAAQQ